MDDVLAVVLAKLNSIDSKLPQDGFPCGVNDQRIKSLEYWMKIQVGGLVSLSLGLLFFILKG